MAADNLPPLNPEKECRDYFPSLAKSDFIYADNAGGSQVLNAVAVAVSDYLLFSNVQVGADYTVSQLATKRVTHDAPAVTAKFMNAKHHSEIYFGHSATQLVANLGKALETDVVPGQDEIICSQADHEANIGPWVRLAEAKNLKVKWWEVRKEPYPKLEPADLEKLITKNTRIVAFTACSNVLGEFTPVKSIVESIKAKAKSLGNERIQFCIDCVAFAPHRRINVEDWGVDYAFFSYYKVYGPHTSVLYVSSAAKPRLNSLMHYFLPPGIQPGGPSPFELVFSTAVIPAYIASLASPSAEPTYVDNPNLEGDFDSQALDQGFKRIAAHDQKLNEVVLTTLLDLKKQGKVESLWAPENMDSSDRAPTISFLPKGKKSKDVVAKFDEGKDIGIRFGNFYAYRLATALLPDPSDGIVRISFAHYNTVEEAQKIANKLREVL